MNPLAWRQFDVDKRFLDVRRLCKLGAPALNGVGVDLRRWHRSGRDRFHVVCGRLRWRHVVQTYFLAARFRVNCPCRVLWAVWAAMYFMGFGSLCVCFLWPVVSLGFWFVLVLFGLRPGLGPNKYQFGKKKRSGREISASFFGFSIFSRERCPFFLVCISTCTHAFLFTGSWVIWFCYINKMVSDYILWFYL